MKYPAYPKYKPSSVEWLGEVPAHWEIKMIRRVAYRIKTGSTPPTAEEHYYENGSVPWFGPGSFDADITLSKPVKLINESAVHNGVARLFKEGATMIVAIGATLGKVSSLTTAASCNQQITVIEFDAKRVFPRFGTYQLKRLEPALHGIAPSATLPILVQNDIAKIHLALPSIAEQRAIADFLDRATAKLDTLLAKKRELIEKLKEKRTALISRTVTRGLPPEAARAAGLDPNPRLKPSGIEWLGEVPEHWKVSKIRFEATLISKGTTPSTIGKETVDEGIRFLKAENIHDGKVSLVPDFFIDAETDQLLARSRLKGNDVLIVIAGATTGKTAVLSKDLLPANTNQAVCFIRLKNSAYATILSAWITTKFVQDIVWNQAVQAAQPNLAMENIRAISCLVPPLPEQRALADYLDRETSKIDQMVAMVEEAVARLQEYRSGLITAAVTGKIDVRKT
ncbi:MAG: restriction endonuclease subunit S [bacterium]